MSSTRAPEVLAVFDFDGTLTTRDTMLAFCRYVAGPGRYASGLLSLLPRLLLFKAGLISNTRAKEAFLRQFLAGKTREELEQQAAAFCREVLPGLIRPNGLAAILEHKANGHEVVIVTASLDLWVRPWAESEGLVLQASAGEFSEGRFTGKLSGANCHGAEKVRRLEAWLAETGVRPGRTIAYGDSGGDRELLAWADEGRYRAFH